jgi:hypothetical protein
VRRISTDSTLGPTEIKQPEGAEGRSLFVPHVSQQETKSDPQNGQSDHQNKEKIPSSEHYNSQGPMTQDLPSFGQKESEQQATATLPPEQRNAQSQTTGPLLHPVQKYSQLQMTEAVSLPKQNEAQECTALADEENHTRESAAGSGLLPNTVNEDAPSISSKAQETSAYIPGETTSDHSVTISRNDRSSVAVARVQLAVRGICEKREALLGMRVKVQEDRKSIRYKRSALAELNARVLQHIQKTVALEFPTSPAPPPELLIKLQEGLEDLQVSEAEFDATEDLLNRKEWELKEAEKEVYQSPFFEQADVPTGDSTAFIGEELADTASDSTVGAEPVRSPLEKQYLSLKGDAQILNEELHQLRAERAYLVEEDRARQAMGRSLDPESRKFLEDFDARHNQLKQDLFYVQEDMFRLQNAISNQSDFLYTASHFDSVQSDDVPLSVDALLGGDLPSSNGASPCVVAPTGDKTPLVDPGTTSHPLLLNSDAPSPRFSTVSLDLDERRLSTVSYINEWLLHRLRRSPLEILRFKSYLRDMHIDADQLKTLVLEWWPNDEMPVIYSEARRRSRISISFTAPSGQRNVSTQTRRSDSVIVNHRRLGQRSQRGALLASRDRSSATLDCLVNNLTLHRPSPAASF